MRRLTALLAMGALAAVLAAPAQGAPADFGIASFAMSPSLVQAGAHPDLITTFELNRDAEGVPVAPTRTLTFELPAGFAGDPAAFPTCTARQLTEEGVCPIDSQVGSTKVTIYNLQKTFLGTFTEPVYNMAPPPGAAAQFGFIAEIYPVVIDVGLDPSRDYALTARSPSLPSLAIVAEAVTTFWGVPADPSHDPLRITPTEAFECPSKGVCSPGRKSSLIPVPFMSNPTSCAGPREASMSAESYELFSDTRTALVPAITGCGLLDFKPIFSLQPTTAQAQTPMGLEVELTMPQRGLEHPNLLAESHLKRAEVTLPEGITVNPSEAVGIGVCSPADYARETATSAPNAGCPETSKIGNASASSPLLNETAEGGLYLAKPYDNPFGSLLALYMVLKVPDRGVIVKLPAKVVPDPSTGRLVTTFDELPQLPVAAFKLHFREGARAPLVSPPLCGAYQSLDSFTPWSDPEATLTSASEPFQITRGIGGGPCPSGGAAPFAPGFVAGTLNNAAASYSPMVIRVSRNDGEQEITRFSAQLPLGLSAKLAGVPFCPDANIELAKGKTGAQEEAEPSCPASSQIGHTFVGAGVGPVLAQAPGQGLHGRPV